MGRFPSHERRPQDFKPGRIPTTPPAEAVLAAAARASYRPDGTHKSHPAPNGEWDFVPASGGTRCLHIDQRDWPKLEAALRQAIRAGVVDQQLRGDFPARCWVFVNDTLNEARLSNEVTGEYHGFPIDYEGNYPSDPGNALARAPRIEVRIVR
jgi:hypothetical protein